MTTTQVAGTVPATPDGPAGREAFLPLVRAEWTKLRTVRGWVVGLGAAALVTLLLGMLTAAGSQISCSPGPGNDGRPGQGAKECGIVAPPAGPDGEAVRDAFYFVNQTLSGDGSITARVTSLTGQAPDAAGPEPWAKAGLIVKADLAQGSRYAAIMVTGDHGVRMQHDYTHDVAGRAGRVSASAPRWLRLTRSGDRVTGYESADGTRWTEVGSTRLPGLRTAVPVGMFVTSPDHVETTTGFGMSSTSGGPNPATATFDDVGLAGGWRGSAWSGRSMGPATDGPTDAAPEAAPDAGITEMDGFEESGGSFTVRGTGDIAPHVNGPSPAGGLERSLAGTFAGLIGVIVVGALFVTAEYRRHLIHTTFTAAPRRGRVLAAKAVVLGSVSLAVGLAASLASAWVVGGIRRSHGEVFLPMPALTEVRIVLGTAAVIAVSAVLALAIGALLRRSAGAVALTIALVVLPYILAVAAVLPLGPAESLLRVTPAAAFAVQQSMPEYEHVLGDYSPPNGYFPLAPWAGFAVLCAWTAAALGLAALRLNRRDA